MQAFYGTSPVSLAPILPYFTRFCFCFNAFQVMEQALNKHRRVPVIFSTSPMVFLVAFVPFLFRFSFSNLMLRPADISCQAFGKKFWRGCAPHLRACNFCEFELEERGEAYSLFQRCKFWVGFACILRPTMIDCGTPTLAEGQIGGLN